MCRTVLVVFTVLMPAACYQSSNGPAIDTDTLEDSATASELDTESGDSDTPVDTETDSLNQIDSSSTSDSDTLPLDCQSEILFSDSSLESLIRQTIDKSEGEIFFSDISSVFNLDFSLMPIGPGSGDARGDIIDLSGLQCFINLNTLALRNHQIVDISPLAALINLKELNLIDNFVVDIEPLSHLTALEILFLSDNQIVDISPLTALSHLEWLDLSYNQITDLESVVSNTALAQGATLGIVSNPYDCDDITTQNQISTLENRGVDLYHDCE